LNLLQQASPDVEPVANGTLTFTLTFTPPNLEGKVDIKILKATDLLNADYSLLNDKSDPYVEVLVDDVSVGKTKTINNNQDPEWNETISFEAKGKIQKLMLVVWDADYIKSDPLGALRLPLAEIVKNKALAGEYVLAPFRGTPAAGTLSFELVYHPSK